MKRALVIEGGGMRGAHTCGALMALVETGLRDFDVIAAASSGACTSAFFVSRQFDLMPVIWTGYLHDGRFINLWRLPTGRPVMDLDYLIDDVFARRERLDTDGMKASATRFFIPATDCETGKAAYFNNHEHPILPALKASAAIPLAYNGPVIIGGRSYMDGGITEAIPIQMALAEGCEEIYLLLTREAGYRKKPFPLDLFPFLFRSKYPRLAEALARRHLLYNETLEKIEKGSFPARLHIIRPSSKLPLTRLTTNLAKIRSALEMGRHDALRTLSN